MPPEALELCASRNNISGGNYGGILGARRSMGPRGAVTVRKSTEQRAPIERPDPVAKLQRNSQPWAFDVWSLGSILLELCEGRPLWLSYKCRVADDQRTNSAALGLFAVPGRDPEKILQKQSDAVRQRGLQRVLQHSPGVPMDFDGSGYGLDLL